MVSVKDAREIRMVVLGLGNLMRTDDAVGMLATQRLRDSGRLPDGVEVLEGGTLGLDLLGLLFGATHLLVLDAVSFGAEPGTMRRFEGEEVSRLPTAKSVHLLGLSDLINVMRLMDAPAMEIVLFGVEPESTDWGTELTPLVGAAQDALMESALEQIADWTEAACGLPDDVAVFAL
jgi:hydrogenase maturation protease